MSDFFFLRQNKEINFFVVEAKKALFKEQGCCNINWQKPGSLQSEQRAKCHIISSKLEFAQQY